MRLHLSELKPYANAGDVPPRHDRAAKRIPSHLDSKATVSSDFDIVPAAHKDASRAGIDKVTREPGIRSDEPDNNLSRCLKSFSASAWHA
jgi:hypothetical protein